MLRLVLDTNTALSGLLWGGTPKRLIMAARAAEVRRFCSVPLLEELVGVIHRKKFTQQLAARGLKAEELFTGYSALRRTVEPVRIERTSSDCIFAAQAQVGGEIGHCTSTRYVFMYQNVARAGAVT